ncbi:MAG: ABC transporter ATP-binding protein [Nitrospinae bacterium]|nr:ABC transporter ATP-binding protein [Nitrospinota bacterium]
MNRVPLLEVADLSVQFQTRRGTIKALEAVSLTLERGEIIGVVGESGSGKSVTAYSIMGILDPAARVISGRIVFGGLDLLRVAETELATIRGRELAMIFQNPRGALNPIRTVGRQVADVLHRHANLSHAKLKDRAIELLAHVRIPDAERRYAAYPFELSGGMCQRVGIAMALACEPALLIADEPTTGVDVTTQAAIMDLLVELARRRRMATLLITHDLGLAAEYCERIVVMHAGHVVETAPVGELFAKPRHPYTAKLIASTPHGAARIDSLTPIPGSLPDLSTDLPPCRYSGRCERYTSACDQTPLPRLQMAASHLVACWHPL